MDAQVSWKSLPGSYGYSLGQTMRLVWSHRSQSDHHSSCLCQQENALSQYNCDGAVKCDAHRSLVHPHWFTSQWFMKSGKQCTQLISINHINQSLGSIIDLWRWLFLNRSLFQWEHLSLSMTHIVSPPLSLSLSLSMSLSLAFQSLAIHSFSLPDSTADDQPQIQYQGCCHTAAPTPSNGSRFHRLFHLASHLTLSNVCCCLLSLEFECSDWFFLVLVLVHLPWPIVTWVGEWNPSWSHDSEDVVEPWGRIITWGEASQRLFYFQTTLWLK